MALPSSPRLPRVKEAEAVAEDRHALDVEVAELLAEQVVDRGEVDLTGFAAQRAVGRQIPPEGAVAAVARARADSEQRAERAAL